MSEKRDVIAGQIIPLQISRGASGGAGHSVLEHPTRHPYY